MKAIWHLDTAMAAGVWGGGSICLPLWYLEKNQN
jgi:hypothetical protein